MTTIYNNKRGKSDKISCLTTNTHDVYTKHITFLAAMSWPELNICRAPFRKKNFFKIVAFYLFIYFALPCLPNILRLEF